MTDVSKTVVYPSVWPSAKARMQTLKHDPDKIGEIQLSSPIFPTVKEGFLSVGIRVKKPVTPLEKFNYKTVHYFYA